MSNDAKYGGGAERGAERAGDLTGVAGYVPAGEAEKLQSAKGREGRFKLQFEPGSDKVAFYVKQADVERIIPGREEGGHRFVQVILRHGAQVETEIQMLRDARNIQDPSLRRLTAAAVSTVSSLSGNE